MIVPVFPEKIKFQTRFLARSQFSNRVVYIPSPVPTVLFNFTGDINIENQMKLATLKGLYDDNIKITISSLPCSIGRSRSADFIIAHVNVSRNHCEITKENTLWKISDYSSSGTYINDSLVGKGKCVILNNGDIVRFGPLESKLCWTFNLSDITDKEIQPENKANNSTGEVSNMLLEKNKVNLPSVEEEGYNEKSKSEKIQELKQELQQVQCALKEIEKNTSVQEETHKKSDFIENITDVMETELQCTICSELFLTAVTLSCTHTFCKYCIDQWKKKQKTCPICRKKITNETRSLVVDNYIDKMIGNLSSELKERREAIIKERNETEPSKKKSKLKSRKF